MKYRFVTNFKAEELKEMVIGVKAAGIEDYAFCKTARNGIKEIVPGYYALYFGHSVTDREEEFFYRSAILALQLKKQGDYVHE